MKISALHAELGLRDVPGKLVQRRGQTERLRRLDQPPSAPEYGDLQSNPDSALARPPVSSGDATPDTQAYCKPAGENLLGCRDGTSDDRHNRDVSEQQA